MKVFQSQQLATGWFTVVYFLISSKRKVLQSELFKIIRANNIQCAVVIFSSSTCLCVCKCVPCTIKKQANNLIYIVLFFYSFTYFLFFAHKLLVAIVGLSSTFFFVCVGCSKKKRNYLPVMFLTMMKPDRDLLPKY